MANDKLREVLRRLATHGDSDATGVLDRDAAQALSSLVTCVEIFRNAARTHIIADGGGSSRIRVDRNMPSGALDALAQLVQSLECLECHEIDTAVWFGARRRG